MRSDPSHAETGAVVAIEVGGHRYEFVPPAEEVTINAGGLQLTVQRLEDHDIEPSTKLISEALTNWIAVLTAEHHSGDEVRKKKHTVEELAREHGWTTLGDITRPSILDAKAGMADLASKTVVNKLYRLKKFLDHCVLADWIALNPAAEVKMPKLIRGDHMRAFTDDEVRRLVALSPAPRRHLYQALAHTGLRKNEAKQLTWRRVHLDAEEPHVLLPAWLAKSRKIERIPLCRAARDAFEAVRDHECGPNDRVFRFPARMTVIRDMERAGVDVVDDRGLTGGWHSFRRSFGTTLARQGVSPAIAQRLTRHADVRTYIASYVDTAQLNEAEVLEDAMSGNR